MDLREKFTTRPVDTAFSEGLTAGTELVDSKLTEKLEDTDWYQGLNDAEKAAAMLAVKSASARAMDAAATEGAREKPAVAGWVSSETLASLTLMIPVVAVGGQLLNRLLDSPTRDWSEDRLTFWMALLVAAALCVFTWPTILEKRSLLARGAVATVFLVLNTLVLCGAAIGIATVVDTGETPPGGIGTATPSATETEAPVTEEAAELPLEISGTAPTLAPFATPGNSS
jgi:hypothetical protein